MFSFFKKKPKESETAIVLKAYIGGESIALKAVADGVFSEGITRCLFETGKTVVAGESIIGTLD